MLSHISVTNFRNYVQCRAAFQPGINVLYGENGAGKTNLLEALSLLAPGRGLRRAALNDFIPFSYSSSKIQNGWGITARLDDNGEAHTLSTGMDTVGVASLLNGESVKRKIRINNTDRPSQDVLTEYLSVLWLTPAMDGLLADAASEKRRFFDRIIFSFDPAHAGRLARYDKALRSRNAVLKDERPNRTWIKSYHETLVKSGIAIAESRNHTVEILNGMSEKLDTPFPKAVLTTDGAIENLLKHKTALEAEHIFREILDNSIESDIAGKTTETGVHKCNYTALHSLKNTEASFCSTGEQKAMLISIILSYAALLKDNRKNATSLLLLDEAAAHLDNHKRASLFDYLSQSGLQVFATGTDKGLFTGIAPNALFLNTINGELFP